MRASEPTALPDQPDPPDPSDPPSVLDAWAELVLGSACVACRRPGRSLCRGCRRTLPSRPRPAWPTPTPEGLVTAYAMGAYRDALRAMVVAHKEDRVLALARALGHQLAGAVRGALGDVGHTEPVLLVPVPSRSTAVRARGYDPMGAITRIAARALRREGRVVAPARLLRLRPGVVDQAGLDAGARARNLAGSMTCPSGRVGRLRASAAHVIVCDDVLTTGATAREAQRALTAAGVVVRAIAVIAATERRNPPRPARAPENG